MTYKDVPGRILQGWKVAGKSLSPLETWKARSYPGKLQGVVTPKSRSQIHLSACALGRSLFDLAGQRMVICALLSAARRVHPALQRSGLAL